MSRGTHCLHFGKATSTRPNPVLTSTPGVGGSAFRCAVPGPYSTGNHLRAPLDQPVTPGLRHGASQAGCGTLNKDKGGHMQMGGREQRTEPHNVETSNQRWRNGPLLCCEMGCLTGSCFNFLPLQIQTAAMGSDSSSFSPNTLSGKRSKTLTR